MLYLQMCRFLLGPVNVVVGNSTHARFWFPQHKAPFWAQVYPEDGYADRKPFKIILKFFQDEGCTFQAKKYEGIYLG